MTIPLHLAARGLGQMKRDDGLQEYVGAMLWGGGGTGAGAFRGDNFYTGPDRNPVATSLFGHDRGASYQIPNYANPLAATARTPGEAVGVFQTQPPQVAPPAGQQTTQPPAPVLTLPPPQLPPWLLPAGLVALLLLLRR